MEQQDKYQMIIHTKGGLIGHVAVEITGLGINDDGRYIRGFAPKEENKIGAALTMEVSGEISDDLVNVEDPENGYIAGPPTNITREQAFAVKERYDSLEGTNLTYDANDNNCVDDANISVQLAGVKGTLNDVLSTKQKEAVNAARVYGDFVYGDPIASSLEKLGHSIQTQVNTSLKDLGSWQAGQTRTQNEYEVTKAARLELEKRGISYVSGQQLGTIVDLTLDRFEQPMEKGEINQVSQEQLGAYVADAIEATTSVHPDTRFSVKKNEIEKSIAQSIAKTPQAQTNTQAPASAKRTQSVAPVTRTNLLTGQKSLTIRAGDTLSALAVSLGTTVDALMEANPQVTNANRIQAGARLAVPVKTSSIRSVSDIVNNISRTIEAGNYVGPSQEYSAEDFQSAAQNQAQLERNTAQRNKNLELGLRGLGMSPENAKNAIAATQPELSRVSMTQVESGFQVGHHRVGRLMRENGIQAVRTRK